MAPERLEGLLVCCSKSNVKNKEIMNIFEIIMKRISKKRFNYE
jgi:hypothetical protein